MTPKGTTSTPSEVDQASGVGRTPVAVGSGASRLVPIVMFASLIVGVVIILFNYLTEDVLGTPNNLYLFTGLGLVLVGIVAATQYR